MLGIELTRLQVFRRWDQVVDIRWSPAGDALAMYALGAAGAEIVIARLDDPQPEVLDTGLIRGTWLDWSSDVSVQEPRESTVWIADLVEQVAR